MTEPKLSICIPSYNRNAAIIKLIKNLLEQLNFYESNLKIIILDNFSPQPYEKDLRKDQKILSAFNAGILKIYRNNYNIGMSANFLKAFELSKSKWLWIVSDDDVILPGAIKVISKKLNTIANNIGVIKFTNLNVTPEKNYEIIDNLKKFIDYNSISKHHFYDFIFISNSIYHVSDFKKILNIGYQNLHTYVPHFLMISEYLKNGGKILNTNIKIVKYQIPKINYSYALVGGLGVGGIKYINLNLTKKYEKKYYSIFFPYNDYKIIIDLYYLKKNSSAFGYEYYAKNYVNLVKIARNPIKILMLNIFWKIGKIRFLFNLLLYVASKVSITFRSHHEEISKKY
jgi:glycosyltransferase involved in cell wall biosynthesis